MHSFFGRTVSLTIQFLFITSFLETESLYIGQTSFAGVLPRMPINLNEFDCSYSLISGGLTNENFVGLNNLNYVVLDGNAFNEAIPSVFGQLEFLEFFYADDALITGDLSYMEGMPVIFQHWIDNNPTLGGPLYSFIGDLTTLSSLSITDNAITGTIPTELGNLTNLRDLWLFGNNLNGKIPSEIGQIKRLLYFQVEGNNLTGDMPAEVCANNKFPSDVLLVLGADCGEVNVSSESILLCCINYKITNEKT